MHEPPPHTRTTYEHSREPVWRTSATAVSSKPAARRIECIADSIGYPGFENDLTAALKRLDRAAIIGEITPTEYQEIRDMIVAWLADRGVNVALTPPSGDTLNN